MNKLVSLLTLLIFVIVIMYYLSDIKIRLNVPGYYQTKISLIVYKNAVCFTSDEIYSDTIIVLEIPIGSHVLIPSYHYLKSSHLIFKRIEDNGITLTTKCLCISLTNDLTIDYVPGKETIIDSSPFIDEFIIFSQPSVYTNRFDLENSDIDELKQLSEIISKSNYRTLVNDDSSNRELNIVLLHLKISVEKDFEDFIKSQDLSIIS